MISIVNNIGTIRCPIRHTCSELITSVFSGSFWRIPTSAYPSLPLTLLFASYAAVVSLGNSLHTRGESCWSATKNGCVGGYAGAESSVGAERNMVQRYAFFNILQTVTQQIYLSFFLSCRTGAKLAENG